MKKNRTNQVSLARRKFLIAANGAGAVGAIAVLVGKGAAVEAAQLLPAPIDPPAGGGYRETEHIRKYYRTARYW